MRTPLPLRTLGAVLLVAITVACSGTPSQPSGPSVDGVWTGTWGGTAIRMTLQQSGSSVSGEIQVGNTTRSLTGNVDDAGRFAWGSETGQNDCTTYSSAEFQLQNGGDAMAGRMTRASQTPPCGSTNRVAITQGDASLTRAF